VSDVDALSMLEFIEHIFEYVFILLLLLQPNPLSTTTITTAPSVDTGHR
jgi:hypothetical protein